MDLFPIQTGDALRDRPNELSLIFGQNVKMLRLEQGLNKKSFAMICDISRPLLDEIENGTSNVRLSYVQKIADALSVRPADLLVGKTHKANLFM